MASTLVAWVETLPLHDAVRDTPWVVPALQSVHILAIALLFGSSLVLALRAFGAVGPDWSAAQWANRLGPWLWSALGVLLLTGAAMILGEPERTLPNATFQVKMIQLVPAVALAALLLRRLRAERPPGAIERGLAGLMMLLWVLIVCAGRWIAYS